MTTYMSCYAIQWCADPSVAIRKLHGRGRRPDAESNRIPHTAAGDDGGGRPRLWPPAGTKEMCVDFFRIFSSIDPHQVNQFANYEATNE